MTHTEAIITQAIESAHHDPYGWMEMFDCHVRDYEEASKAQKQQHSDSLPFTISNGNFYPLISRLAYPNAPAALSNNPLTANPYRGLRGRELSLAMYRAGMDRNR